MTTQSSRHLDACRIVTLRQMSEAWDKPLPAHLEAHAEDHGVMDCADGCPSLAASIERGRELAERFGW